MFAELVKFREGGCSMAMDIRSQYQNSGGPNPEELERIALLSQMRGTPEAMAARGPLAATVTSNGQGTGGVAPAPTPTPTSDPAGIAAAPAAPARDTSKWNTDGYATPGYTAQNYGDAPAGFDQTKWNNADHQTPKYVLGRITNSYAQNGRIDKAGMEKAFADIQKAYPGSTWSGKDKVTVPGVGTIDLVKDMSDDGMGEVQYGVADGGGKDNRSSVASAAGLLDPTGMSSGDAVQSLTTDSVWKRLMAQINAINGPAATDKNALMSLLAKQ